MSFKFCESAGRDGIKALSVCDLGNHSVQSEGRCAAVHRHSWLHWSLCQSPSSTEQSNAAFCSGHARVTAARRSATARRSRSTLNLPNTFKAEIYLTRTAASEGKIQIIQWSEDRACDRDWLLGHLPSASGVICMLNDKVSLPVRVEYRTSSCRVR